MTSIKDLILGFKKATKLVLVKIYFATPTFDQITKDLKANFMTKISTIGTMTHLQYNIHTDVGHPVILEKTYFR